MANRYDILTGNLPVSPEPESNSVEDILKAFASIRSEPKTISSIICPVCGQVLNMSFSGLRPPKPCQHLLQIYDDFKPHPFHLPQGL